MAKDDHYMGDGVLSLETYKVDSFCSGISLDKLLTIYFFYSISTALSNAFSH